MFGLIMVVGPGERKVSRMHDTLAMVADYERAADIDLVVIDDGAEPRSGVAAADCGLQGPAAQS